MSLNTGFSLVQSATESCIPADRTAPVSVGVVGCGYWGPKLVRNFSRALGSRVAAVADLNRARLRDVAAEYPVERVTEDYRELLGDESIDAIAIATPVATHYRLAREALLAGKHVLVEKPLTTNSTDAAELVQLARARDLVLMVDHTYLFTGAVEKIHELLANGELGEILYFDSIRINLGLFQHDVDVVWDLAPHDLSILFHVIGKEPVAVSALGASQSGIGQANLAYVTVTFEDGTLAHCHVNWLAPKKIRQILIGGKRRMLLYDDMESNEKIKIYDRGVTLANGDPQDIYDTRVQYRTGDMWAPRVDPTEALLKECRYFSHCIRRREQPFNDGRAGLQIVRILEAASASLQAGGRPIAVR